MNNLIERYVYDVVRRLPAKEQIDIEKDLTSNIYDMLSPDPSEEEIKKVLTDLGSPAKLSSQYRQSGGYLISPAIYPEYIRALKWIVPLVAIVLGIISATNSIFESATEASITFVKLLSSGFAGLLSGAKQGTMFSVFWTTFGFAIADRTSPSVLDEWNIDTLPEIPVKKEKRIPLSDIIAELVLSILFLVALILVYFRDSLSINIGFIFNGSQNIVPLFNDAFFTKLIICVSITTFLVVISSILKFVYRVWNAPVGIFSIIEDIVTISLLPFLFSSFKIFHPSFVDFLGKQDFTSHEFFQKLQFTEYASEPAIYITCAIIVIIAVINIIATIYKMIKSTQ